MQDAGFFIAPAILTVYAMGAVHVAVGQTPVITTTVPVVGYVIVHAPVVLPTVHINAEAVL